METIEKDNHSYIDLGLPSGLLWATCNVGASSPEQYGDYFAWGETETKDVYTEENCKTCAETMSDISGDSRYDVARAKWGGSWRMPTKTEMDELENKCQWQWTTVNGIKGCKVTGSNGNSIFLPAAGFRIFSNLHLDGLLGSYWSSTPCKNEYYNACGININDKLQNEYWSLRVEGQTIRPVKDGSVIN